MRKLLHKMRKFSACEPLTNHYFQSNQLTIIPEAWRTRL